MKEHDTTQFSIYVIEKGTRSVRVLGKNKRDAIDSSGLGQRDATDKVPSIEILKKNIKVVFTLDEDGQIQDYICSDGFGIVSNEVQRYFYPNA